MRCRVLGNIQVKISKYSYNSWTMWWTHRSSYKNPNPVSNNAALKTTTRPDHFLQELKIYWPLPKIQFVFIRSIISSQEWGRFLVRSLSRALKVAMLSVANLRPTAAQTPWVDKISPSQISKFRSEISVVGVISFACLHCDCLFG